METEEQMLNEPLLIDGATSSPTPDGCAEEAVAFEKMGLDAAWTFEASHDPFLPLVLAADRTKSINLGTAIAVAFARNPMTCAVTSWDLQRLSEGRFILGLGTQIKPHITRRAVVKACGTHAGVHKSATCHLGQFPDGCRT